jgi:hypothetical protein
MTIYKKPFYYTLSHIICGMISFHCPFIGVLFLIYQFLQLYLDKRFFVFELRIRDGNSIDHTLVKIKEFLIGVLFGLIIFN